MINRKSTYQNHKIKGNLVSASKKTFEVQKPKPDREYMNDQMKTHFKFFEKYNINKFQKFIPVLHNFGIKSQEQLSLIEAFAIQLKFVNRINIFLLKRQEMKKANAGERNILMNRLAAEYPDDFFIYLKNYFLFKYPQKVNTESLINDLKMKIDQLKQQRKESESISFVFNSLESFDDFSVDEDQSFFYSEFA